MKKLLFAINITLLFSLAYKSLGQTDTTEKKLTQMSLEELMNIKVRTSNKQVESLKNIPASIVIITRKDIENQGYHDLEDLMSDIPSFYSLGNAYYYGGVNYGIRGFSKPGTFNNVMILVNGVNQLEDYALGYSTDRINVPIQAIDRIEIIRGPMAIIYGSTAFMGVINILTNEDDKVKKNSQASLSYGSLNTYDAFLRLSDKGENYSYSINAGINSTDGMDIKYTDLQENVAFLNAFGLDENSTTKGQYIGESKYLSFTGTSKNISVNVDISDNAIGVPVLVPVINDDGGAYTHTVSSNFNINYKYTVNDKINFLSKYTYSNYSYDLERAKAISDSNYALLMGRSSAQEIEFNGFYEVSKNLKITIGLYDRFSNNIKRNSDIPIQNSINAINYLDPDKPINLFAAMTEVSYKLINEKLNLIGGLRIEKLSDYQILSENGSLSDSIRLIEVRKQNFPVIENNEPQFIPRFAAIYNINTNNVIKLIYSQSKRRSSFLENYSLQDNITKNEIDFLTFSDMTTYELNYLTAPIKNLSINLSGYYNQLNNLVNRSVIDTSGKPFISISNKGKMHSIGGELTAKYIMKNKLIFDLSFSYQKTTDDTPEFDTLEVAASPNILTYFKISYLPINNLTIGLKANYVGEMYAEWFVSEGRRYGKNTPAYLLLSVNLRYEMDNGFFINLHGSNLLDQEIRYPSDQNSPWMDRGMLGFERRFKITAGLKF